MITKNQIKAGTESKTKEENQVVIIKTSYVGEFTHPTFKQTEFPEATTKGRKANSGIFFFF